MSWRTPPRWVFRPCARSPRPRASNPTRWCAWRGRSGSRATRISARRSGTPIKAGAVSFPDRARWLQDVRKSGDLGGLYADMVGAAIRNLEETFAGIDAAALKARGRGDLERPQHLHARCGRQQLQRTQFHLSRLHRHGAVPRDPAVRIHAGGRSCMGRRAGRPGCDDLPPLPHRGGRDSRNCARTGADGGGPVSDSPASPIVRTADHGFVVAVDTPQFFPSSVSTIALLETLLSFVIAVSSEEIVERVERFHRRTA
jgi:hypothetical protein